MFKFIKENFLIFLLLIVVLAFFREILLSGLFPMPTDTIVGLYHPFLDLYAVTNPSGVPFHNFLITDPVRQLIPWKMLVVDNLSSFLLPTWNPYEMAGKPLLANFQSSVFYPLNLALFIKPPYIGWTIFIILQPLLASLFTFLYLKNLKLDSRACFLGSMTFAFGAFSMVWMEWGNIVHTALWLPLILLSIDKIKSSDKFGAIGFKNIWQFVFLFSLVFSFFAGHLQTFFYLFIISLAYLLLRWFERGREISRLVSFLILYIVFILITFIQWYPTLKFLNLSARSMDQNPLTTDGWFIPFQHLVQFIIPDFFGNPATLNYFGVWNYGELVGYVGIASLFLALFAFFSKNKKETFFFSLLIIASLLFALPTILAKVPFNLEIPFLSSAQPTRLLFLTTFSLSCLAAIGFNTLITNKKINLKLFVLPFLIFGIIFSVIWAIFAGYINLGIEIKNLEIVKRNIIFPSAIFAISAAVIAGIVIIKEELTKQFLILALIAIATFDLFRFGSKFTTFSPINYFFPETKAIKYLQDDKSVFRISTTDSRILPPNFSTYYKLQSIDGYDPLYLLRYAEFIAASFREDRDLNPPFGFNRIITFQNSDSRIIDFLGVKYVLSLTDQENGKLVKVFSEGNTRVYQNSNAYSRAFFVSETIEASNKEEAISLVHDPKTMLNRVAIVESEGEEFNKAWSSGRAEIIEYLDNKVSVKTDNGGVGFLVLTDVNYPTWRVKIDGVESTVYQTDYAFRGVVVPKGQHEVVFYNTLF